MVTKEGQVVQQVTEGCEAAVWTFSLSPNDFGALSTSVTLTDSFTEEKLAVPYDFHLLLNFCTLISVRKVEKYVGVDATQQHFYTGTYREILKFVASCGLPDILKHGV